VNIRHPLRSGFTAYGALSPENSSFASVAPWEIERLPGALTPALRRRDHTLLPYASITLVGRNCHVHRIPAPRFDDRERPSEWDGIDIPINRTLLLVKRNFARRANLSQALFLPLSPCGRGWTQCAALRTGEGFSPHGRLRFLRIDTPHPALRATFSHKGEGKHPHPQAV